MTSVIFNEHDILMHFFLNFWFVRVKHKQLVIFDNRIDNKADFK